jgi:GGDEF domain-containing protein
MHQLAPVLELARGSRLEFHPLLLGSSFEDRGVARQAKSDPQALYSKRHFTGHAPPGESRYEQSTLRQTPGGRDIRLSISIGAARMPADGDTAAAALACADERLFQAKRAGRNCIVA